ncbi:PPOX class F420-dependent protein, Rv2061 family [Mycolicibacterium phlei]|jgi:PPOX class probable F420-dependent enzyme|uniref:PPOX class F420-dependent enzyme n=1 Tax=Mycolicibacterium phlei DSM 43239 = CCUG 21000 TaxID=1226750 RepID=A0A5N5US50_MYCPH|nr:PPOX class F420-dependent oxidoreductase [Mycolicibacterium phlei]VEG09489.1 PPOX class F420-dependent protein, Rv2061 family [Mycobacteroides chelonae]AMO61375.1 Pyridoxamine 5'-phosphate oxidase [Mycolicibacterium phlei]KAB7752393.1 PPOX class F420-dependent enzyme [Mycolicibacterium phlei DSM 43239 = CCUG 21000]KXW60741.1 PPOX class F420-dependent enzyme [Mycolicibacterium phlei DSM 43239 = CCUG 21000]KXW63040.1 PPOX class F420-dependent enzyme [Mycolicibacterium phlei DSM 43072]
MAATFDDVAKSDYILLTTFTKDGTPKPTPVWAVPDGDRLLVITQETSWKVKRIRNTPRVTIAPCDMRGNVKGEAAEAVAAVLGKSENAKTYAGLGKRYGLFGKVFCLFSKLRGGMQKNVTLEIKPA